MMPIETKLSIPTEESSLQNMAISNEDQSQTCLLPSNLNKRTSLKQNHHRDPHLSSTLNHKYVAPFQYEWDINNKMIPFGYYLQSGRCVNENNGNNHQILPFSVSLNPSLVSIDSSTSIPNCNEINSTKKIDYQNHIPSYPVNNEQHIWGPSYSLPTTSSMSTSVASSAKTKRKYTGRMRQRPTEQQLLQYPSTFPKPIFSNYWSSLPLPSMSNTLARPNEYKFPVDLIKTSNFVPLSLPDLPILSASQSITFDNKSNSRTVQQHLLPHQTVGQYSLDQRCNCMQNTFSNSSASNLSNHLSYFMNHPHEQYYRLSSNPMSLNIPTVACPTLLPELDTTCSFLSPSNNMKKMQQTSETIDNSSVNVQISERNMISLLRRHKQKKSKIEDHRTRILIKRTKQRNRLAVLKFMIRKRKQEKLSKKQLPEMKINEVIPPIVDNTISKPMEMETKSTNIIASSLKVTLNAAQQVERISLHYHQRHKPQDNTENRLDLLIEAVDFLEMHNDSSKLALESLD